MKQAEQVVFADVDSYVEQQTGEDPGHFKPTEENSNPLKSDKADAEVKTEAEAETTAARTDPDIAAPRTGLSDEQAKNLNYTAGPTAEQVTAGNEMGLGHKGGAVNDVQQFLVDGGFFGEGADAADQADGMFGPKTQAALTAWQKKEGLDPSGSVDAATLKAMGLGGDATETKKADATTSTNTDDVAPEALRTAMGIRDDLAGPGNSDYKGMAANILGMSPSEVADLKNVYPTISGGESLEAALRSDFAINGDPTSDHDIEAVVAIINGDRTGAASETGAIRDADKLKEAMLGSSGWNPLSGIGTDNAVLRNILANRSPAQMEGIAAEFEAQTGKNLRATIMGETGMAEEHQLKGIYTALLDNAGVE